MRTILGLLGFLVACNNAGTKPGTSVATTDDPDGDTGSIGTDTVETTPESCPAVVQVSTSPGVQPLEQRISVTLDGPGNAYAVCRSDADPEELHLVESTEAAESHELVLRGLLGETPYACDVRPVCGGEARPVEFTSGTPSGIPRFEAYREPSLEMSGAYTLLNSQQGCFGGEMWVLMTDPEGKVRWMYPVGEDYVADMDAYLIDAQTVHIGGGWGLMSDGAPNRGVFRTIDLSGQVLVERTVPDFGLGFNHHSEPLSDGTYVSLTGHLDVYGTRDWHGVGIEVWSPTEGLVWTWDSQALVDSGFIDPPSSFNEDLPYHANAVTLLTDSWGDAAWVSNFGLEEIWRIDRQTGEITHIFGHGGDFTLSDPSGAPLPDGEYPWVQHGVDYQDDRMLVYDNGTDDNQSRVVEYAYDLDTLEATLLWEWTEPNWYDPIIGDADYLPNGNVLVAQGFSSCISIFQNDVSEVVELAPPDQVVWRLRFPTENYAMYRAERYDGCDVFGNARYCPAIAERIAELDAR